MILAQHGMMGFPNRLSAVQILAYEYSISNLFVDIYFSGGLYGNDTLTSGLGVSDFTIENFVSGGVTAIAIDGVKRPTGLTSAAATNLIGGEEIIRIFLTLTGTPDSTETFEIHPVINGVFDDSRRPLSSALTTGTIKLNITPFVLYDSKRASTITVTGLGISALNDVMGNVNLTQSTDADRPAYTNGTRITFDRSNTEFLTGGNVAALAFQQGDDFTVVIHNLNSEHTATSGYIVSNRQSISVNNRGWSIHNGTDGSLFISMHDGTAQNFADFDTFGNVGQKTMIFENSGGVLSIYDDTNTLVGAQGSTSIGAITYTSINFQLGERGTDANFYFNGYIENISIFDSALTSDQRQDVLDNFHQTQVVNELVYPPTSVQAFNTAFAAQQVGAFISYGMTTYMASDSYEVNKLIVPPVAATFAPPANILTLAQGWVDDIEATGKVDFYCFTTGHHVGFSMWDTQVTLKQQSVTADPILGTTTLPIRNPYKNSTYDIIGTLVTAARGYSKPVYLYYNMGRRVNERGSGNFGSADFFLQFEVDQMKELIDLYHPDGFFVDGQQEAPWIDNNEGSYLHRLYSRVRAHDPDIKFITNEAPINGSLFAGKNLNKFPSDVSCLERDIGRVLTDTGEYDHTILKNWNGTNYVRNVCDIITTNTNIIYFGSEDKGATDRSQAAVQAYYDASKAVGVPIFFNFSPSQDGTLQASQIAFLTNLTL